MDVTVFNPLELEVLGMNVITFFSLIIIGALALHFLANRKDEDENRIYQREIETQEETTETEDEPMADETEEATPFVMTVDGVNQIGLFKCKDKECGWEGNYDDASSITVPDVKFDSQLNGYTFEYKEDGEGNEITSSKRMVVCPECNSIVEFVKTEKKQ